MPGILHVQRDDSMFKYPDDRAAALAAEQDGIKLIYGMAYVPDGVYLDTTENRTAIADYFERHRLSLPASPELTQAIYQRMDNNLAEYKARFEGLSALEIFPDAAEIAAVCDSYYYFRNEHAFTTGQAEFLLKLKDPLDFVSDRWMTAPTELVKAVNGMFYDQERTLQKGGYELMSDEGAPSAPGPFKSKETGVTEKPSVLDRIRRHQEEQRNNPSSPKDTPDRKKYDTER
jgi:hypothetical protein